MKLSHGIALSILLNMVAGCAQQPSQSTFQTVASMNSLTIYDAAQNVLVDEDIPTQGWTPLNIVMRQGSYEESEGVFVKINGNVRFVPWPDLIADPLGQRFYSDSFIKAGELTLRVTKAPCGGRLPLTFQLKELKPKVLPLGSESKPSLADISYEPLSNWTESGLYLPSTFADQLDGRWEKQECQPATAPPVAAFAQQALNDSHIQPAFSDEKAAIRKAEKLPAWGKPCRLCRHDDTGNEYGDDSKW